tara:strand:+ start:2654 stop:4552 length:1899 start_codon:yes stop_codon:yes gene_type:complete
MCGIAGFIDFNNTTDKRVLNLMINTLSHRGPDGDGVEIVENKNFTLGLGHKRLSIIDLRASANQPMSFGSLKIVFNGEVYNYNEIKEELKKLGHSFETDSDTEVILHSFKEWGEKCVDKFIGMFAFLIFDEETNEIYIFRDRAGVKPVYYYEYEGLFLFSSELKSFHQHSNFKKEIDNDSAGMFFKYGYIPEPYSIFKNTKKLLSGHFLKYNLNTLKKEVIKYWDINSFYKEEKLNITEEEALDKLESLCTSAFQYRMVSDVPVGVFLSGGYDSTFVTALLQKNQKEKIKTFTIGFEESEYNEATYAKEIAQYLGTEHYEYYCTSEDARKVIPLLPKMYDEPFGDSSAIPTYLVSKMAKEKVTVALSADGGDEIFAGYNRYKNIVEYHKKLQKIPKVVQPILGYFLSKKITHPIFNLFLGNKSKSYYDGLSAVLNSKGNFREIVEMSVTKMSTSEVNRVLINKFENKPNNFKNDNEDYSLLDTCLSVDYKTYLVDDILTKVDRSGMAVSLEGREPLLDHRIIEFVSKLPDNFKINGSVQKYLLKKLTHKLIPKEMLDRPKTGFSIPLINWFREDLKNLLLESLDEDRIKKQNLFDVSYINRAKKDYLGGSNESFYFIWNMIVFQMWHKEWIE